MARFRDSKAAQKLNTIAYRRRYRALHLVIAVMILLGAMAAVHYAPMPAQGASRDVLQLQIHALRVQIEQLRQEQSMPALVLNRYRNSIGYIYGVYHIGFANQPPLIRARISGTGFLVGDALVATNHHIAEPWYGDLEAEKLILRGATPIVETLVIFFPGWSTPVPLSHPFVSKTSDVAVLRAEDSDSLRRLPALPLAKIPASAGQFIDVIGYPMAIAGMIAKSPAKIHGRLAYRPYDIDVANELAAMSLIRPFSTCGHLGDVIEGRLIYDAPTAHGGSGGPVFNSNGEVIGINSAYVNGFSGGSIGASIESVRGLLQEIQVSSELPTQTAVSLYHPAREANLTGGGKPKKPSSTHSAEPRVPCGTHRALK
jgi:Trypsin-like peptidase domain